MELPLKMLVVLHPAAVGLLTFAAFLNMPLLVRAAGIVGSAGAVAFLLHAVTVGLRTMRHRRNVGAKDQPRDLSHPEGGAIASGAQ